MNKKNFIFGLIIVLALIGFLKRDFFLDLFSADHSYRKDTLTIVLNTPATDLSAYSTNLNNLIRTANVYQGLVAFDKYLKITPSLALSWGNIDPLTWEFKLREGVRFHDGISFEAQQVVQNFDEAKLKGRTLDIYLDTIDTIEIINPYLIRIKTHTPDPLLLSKLTKFFISRPGKTGTGPYKIREWVKGKNLLLTAFDDYWGKRPVFRNVQYTVMENKIQRRKEFENGKIDILVTVPRAQALELPQEQLKKSFGLEVNFLAFKLDDPIIGQRRIREAIRTLLDPAKIEAIGNYFVRPASQFIAPGVFGYNDAIPEFAFDETKMAKDLFGNRLEKVTLDYLDTYVTLSEYLVEQLQMAGFSVHANALTPEVFLEKIKNNESSLFIIGWQAENGDAGGFLDAFVHSKGEFNNGRYKNPEIDTLIEASREELDPKKRLSLLQDIMLKIHNDLIGIPLFESSRIYAVKPGISWEPRADGLVLAAEVR